MNRNRFDRSGLWRGLGLTFCLAALAGTAGTWTSFMKRVKMVDAVSAGRVSLAIEEPVFSERYEGNLIKDLLPGETLKKDPVIVLDEGSEEAYIRVRIEYGGMLGREETHTADEEQERLRRIAELEKGIDFAEDWSKGADGFYYYQKKVIPGGRIPFFTQVTIPESWGNEIAEQAFSIDLTAEAVPADYFDPWSETVDGNPVIDGWRYQDGTPVRMQ